jgi:outer membrane protein OmpA-like peptidoglycan-associated protein
MKLKNYIIISFGLLIGLFNTVQSKAQQSVKKAYTNFNSYTENKEYNLTDVIFNSKFSDFGAYEHDGRIYFASSRDEGALVKHIDKKNNEPFLDIYVIDKDSKDTIVDHKSKLKGDVNTIFHEGSLTITKDGKTMYFSRNDFNNNVLGTDENLITHLKIFKATLEKDKWTNIEELPFNGTDFSNVHPALNDDETKLYFASDMASSIGGSDIYFVDINNDGTFGTPQNLGNIVNTKQNERFPFINSEGQLFFASDGHPGLGAFDIFKTNSDKTNNILSVINLGEPVNSIKDDFSFFMNQDGLSGYFASNRDGGVGSDDIYAFDRIPQLIIEGTITDANTNSPLENARVTLLNSDDLEMASVETDVNGYYDINIARGKDYNVIVKKDNYIESNTAVTSKNIGLDINNISTDFVLNLQEKEEIIPIPDLYSIYFDFNKYGIRKDGAAALDNIVNMMVNTYPNMVLKIESHTDSRGTTSYNNKLSEERATATYKYLVNRGVNPDRITEYKGYGEQKLMNECDGTNNCTKAQHQVNRRTEFIVVKMK